MDRSLVPGGRGRFLCGGPRRISESLMRSTLRSSLPCLVLLCNAVTASALQCSTARRALRPARSVATRMASAADAAYEADRLARDAEAMDTMRVEAEEAYENLRTPWKWVIRKRIWDLMEAEDIARQPRPVHHRIPNFDGADRAAKRLASLPEFAAAACVKVNPDTPQRPVRELVLGQGKVLLTPQPRLRTGFFSTLSEETIPPGVKISECTNSKGVAKHGTPVDLDADYTVDLVVVGSTAVCPTTGARVGKGEGFAELEWGILSLMGNLDAQQTLVVTTVHDVQVVDDMPRGQLTKHDVPVDIIVTPTRIIRVSDRAPKPSGVYWDLLSPQKLAQIRVLQRLKARLEQEAGEPLPQGPEETLPPTAQRRNTRAKSKKKPRAKTSQPQKTRIAAEKH